MEQNIYNIKKLKFEEATNIHKYTDIKEGASCIKEFPVFENGKKILKPISKQKPYATEMLAIAEVFCSNLAEFLGYESAEYMLADCEKIPDVNNLYVSRGVITTNFLNDGEKVVTLLDYYRKNKTETLDMDKFINFVYCVYNLELCFDAPPFKGNRALGEDFARKLLFKYLILDANAHFGNMGFIENAYGLKGLPVFDNEYSMFFLRHDDKKDQEDKYEKCMPFITQKVEYIKAKFPKVFKEFQEKIAYLKDVQYIQTLCDFSGLSLFVQDISPYKYYTDLFFEPDKTPLPVDEKTMQQIGERIYNKMNEHIDTLLRM